MGALLLGLGSPTSPLPVLGLKAPVLMILTFPPVPLQDKEPRGIIPLENLSVQKVDDPKKPVGVGVGA